MPHIIYGDIVMLAPKEGHGIERRSPTKHVEGCGLALSFGNNPMLDANGFARAAIRPPSDIARGINGRSAGLQILIDDETPMELETGLLRQLQSRTYTDADNNEIRFDRRPVLQFDGIAFEGGRLIFEVKDDSMFLVKSPDEVAHLRPKHALHRPFARGDDVDFDLAHPQRGSDFESDEACPDDHSPASGLGVFDDGATVCQRTQGVDMRLAGTLDRKAGRLRSGCQQQSIVGDGISICQNDFARTDL